MNPCFFAASILAPGRKLPEIARTSATNATLRDILFVLLCLAVLSLGFLLWAAFIRKRRRHSSGHSHHITRTAAAGEKGTEPRKRRHRHRRRRSASYPRNPTLAQTGGLPPVRRDEPPAPPQQTGTQSL